MKSSRFDRWIDRVLAHEDSAYVRGRPIRVVNHPADPGGATKLGITLRTLRRWRNNPDLTVADLEQMTVDEAKEIYFALYWNAARCDDLPPGLDYAVFDWAVHGGVSRAVRMLQRLLGVREDGVVGPQTLQAVRDYGDLKDLIRRYCQDRQVYLQSRQHANHFPGWGRRVREVEETALAAVGEKLPLREALQTDTVKASSAALAGTSTIAALIEMVREWAAQSREAATSLSQMFAALAELPALAILGIATIVLFIGILRWRSRRW